MPRFSILIPTTGRADLVRPALESSLAQTYRDFEIVIADSGADRDIEIFAAGFKDERIRYLKTPKGGPFIPWDFAEARARGEYILWLDDDNYLLPYALELFRVAVEKTNADIITASHFYYYDRAHPRRSLRNNVGILPFTGKEYFFDPREALRSLYTFSRRGPGEIIPRLHPSETLISRRVTKAARTRLGFVVFHHMASAHPHPVLLAFAKSCYFIDRPVVIVGRLGASMSQTWSTAAKKRFQKSSFLPRLSPFTGYTRLNARFENFLTVKHLLPDLMDDIAVNWERFGALYLEELCYLDSDIKTAFRNWKNFFAFLHTLPLTAQKRLFSQAVKGALMAPFLYCARRLGLHYLWRIFYMIPACIREKKKTPKQKILGSHEFSFPIPEEYGVHSIAELGARLEEILQKETGEKIILCPPRAK